MKFLNKLKESIHKFMSEPITPYDVLATAFVYLVLSAITIDASLKLGGA